MLGYFFDALLFQRRKQFDIATTGLQLDNLQGFGRFGFVQFVGFGQQHQKLQAVLHPGANHVQQDFIELCQAKARVAQQNHGGQVVAGHQVVAHHLLPAVFSFFGYGGIAVARQIGEHRVRHTLFAEREQVDALGAARCFGGISQPVLLRQRVDAG